MKSKVVLKNSIVLGLALFSLYFGAGNLIFPPAIGVLGSAHWLRGFVAYFLADVGLAIVGIVAMIKAKGDMNGITGPIGKTPSTIVNIAVVSCVGPIVALPRTAATSFEFMNSAMLGSNAHPLVLPIFSAVFFVIVVAVSLRPSHVVSSIGRILTPVLVFTLAVIIIAGIAHPATQASAPHTNVLIQEGVRNGYQTLDLLASMLFSIIIIKAIRDFNYSMKQLEVKSIIVACAIASVFLFVVYGGLAYLGATTGQLWVDEFTSGSIDQATLLSNIIVKLMGESGAIFLVIVVVFACLTTAIGLTSSTAAYFSQISHGKISYNKLVFGVCILGFFICNAGLGTIIAVASPILLLLYPVVMFLVFASFIRKDENIGKLACKFGAAAALFVSFCDILYQNYGVQAFAFIGNLPLTAFGFSWLVPALVAAAVGLGIECFSNRGAGRHP